LSSSKEGIPCVALKEANLRESIMARLLKISKQRSSLPKKLTRRWSMKRLRKKRMRS
jgi:hypothetical protein